MDWSWSTTGYNFTGRAHAEVLRLCRLAGLAGIEGVAELFPDSGEAALAATAREYADAGLRIDSFHLPFSSADDIAAFYETTRRLAVDRMLRHLEMAAAVGATVAVQHPSTSRFDVDVEGLDAYLRPLTRSLETLLERAAQLGVALALENMLPGPDGPRLGSRPAHLAAIVAACDHPRLGFCLDTGHALVAGGPDGIAPFLQAMGPRLVAFHLADNAGDRDSHLAPGRGLVDWTVVFGDIAARGWDRPLCIETPPFAHGPNQSYSDAAWKQLVAGTAALAARSVRD